MQKVMIVAAVAALLFLGITGSPDDYGLKSARAQSAGTDNLLFGLETGICEVDSTFAIVVHGGSVFWRGANHSLKLPVTEQILADARVQLAAGARAIDVVEAVVAMPEPVTKANMTAYMAGWKDRVKQLGDTGEIGSRDRVTIDKDGAIVAWLWWSFVGTNYEGSAVTRTTDEGVQYERITYYPNTPEFPGNG